MKKLLIGFFLFLFVLNGNTQVDTTITLISDSNGQDAFTYSGNSTLNFGSESVLETTLTVFKGGATNEAIALLYFDVSSIQEGGAIQNALIYLTPSYISSSNSFTYTIYPITSPWTYSTVTANTLPTIDYSQGVTVSSSMATSVYTQIISVKYMLQEMVDNPSNYYGFAIRVNSSGALSVKEGVAFYSSNDTKVSQSYLPNIKITYYPNSVESTFNDSTKLGEITVNAPAGDLPYTYLLSYDTIPSLSNLWDGMKDTIPVDSTSFFSGKINSQSFTYTNLMSNKYFVKVYDNYGVELMDTNVYVKPELSIVDSLGFVISGDTLSLDTTSSYSICSSAFNAVMPVEQDFGAEIKFLGLENEMVIGLSLHDQPKNIYDNDFIYSLRFFPHDSLVWFYKGSIKLKYVKDVLPEDEFRLMKVGDSLRFEMNGEAIASEKLDEYTEGDLFKTEVKIKGPNSFVLIKPIQWMYKPKVKKKLINPICGGDFGSISIGSSSFFKYNLSYVSIQDENGNVIESSSTIPYVFENLTSGEYTIVSQWVTSNGLIINTSEIVELGYPIMWVNKSGITEVSNTLNTIRPTSFLNLGTANSFNTVKTDDEFWIETYFKGYQMPQLLWTTYSFSKFKLSNGTIDYLEIYVMSISGENWVYFREQGTLLTLNTSLPSNILLNSYWANLSEDIPVRIESDGTTISVKYNGYTLVSINTPTIQDDLRIYVQEYGRFKVENTIASFCYPTASNYVKLRRVLDGGYYQIPDNVLKVEYDEEYEDSDLEFNIYNDLFDPQNPDLDHLVMTMPAISYGDNRLDFDFSCPGSNCLSNGIYILEVINDKNEKLYLRFKIL